MSQKTKVLFLCTGNSCRSQMAEGWAKHLLDDSFEAYSAGIEIHGLNPKAVAVMAEAGVDISNYQSKHVDSLNDITMDFVITVCGHAHETCPIFPNQSKVIHVGFEDPPKLAENLAIHGASEEEQLNCFRQVCDEIRLFVKSLPEFLNKKRENI